MKNTTLLLAFIFGFAYAESNTPFVDIINHEYEEQIMNVYNAGAIQGYPDDTFRPDNEVSRVELLKMLFEYNNIDTEKCDVEINFSDIESEAWYEEYICTAFERGLIQGYPDNTFKPHQTVQFAEAIKILTEFHNPHRMAVAPDPYKNQWYHQYAYRFLMHPKKSMTSYSQAISRGEVSYLLTIKHQDKENIHPSNLINVLDFLYNTEIQKGPIYWNEREIFTESFGLMVDHSFVYLDIDTFKKVPNMKPDHHEYQLYEDVYGFHVFSNKEKYYFSLPKSIVGDTIKQDEILGMNLWHVDEYIIFHDLKTVALRKSGDMNSMRYLSDDPRFKGMREGEVFWDTGYPWSHYIINESSVWSLTYGLLEGVDPGKIKPMILRNEDHVRHLLLYEGRVFLNGYELEENPDDHIILNDGSLLGLNHLYTGQVISRYDIHDLGKYALDVRVDRKKLRNIYGSRDVLYMDNAHVYGVVEDRLEIMDEFSVNIKSVKDGIVFDNGKFYEFYTENHDNMYSLIEDPEKIERFREKLEVLE